MNKLLKRFFKNLFSFILFQFVVSTIIMAAGYQKKIDDFDKIILNRREALSGNKSNKKESLVFQNVENVSREAEKQWNSLEKLLWRTYLWKDISSSSIVDVSEGMRRLKTICLAYSTFGSSLYNNKKLKNDLLFALEWVYKNQLNSELINKNVEYLSNNDIPNDLADILILLNAELSNEQKSKFSSLIIHQYQKIDPVNAVHFLPSYITASAFAKSKRNFETASAIVTETIKNMRGFNEELREGPIQYRPRFPLGRKSLEIFVSLEKSISLFGRSNFFTGIAQEEMFAEWIRYSFLPYMDNNHFIDFIEEKDTNLNKNKDLEYFKFLEGCIGVSSSLKDNQGFRSILKPLLERLSPMEVVSFEISKILISKEILNEKPIPLRSGLEDQSLFPELDRVVVNKNDFSFGISMFSNRTFSLKSYSKMDVNEFLSISGRTLLYNTNFETIGVPLKNEHILYSGTTIANKGLNKTTLPTNLTEISWVGGAEINGKASVIGMDYRDLFSSLSCKKSWFIFDNEIVALGVDINLKENQNVETIMDAFPISPDSSLYVVDGEKKNWKEDIYNYSPEWIFTSSLTDSIGRAIYFPKYQSFNSTLSSIRQPNYVINQLVLSIDHGKKPTNGSYQYVLLPFCTQEYVKSYNNNPDIIVLANSSKVQAVKEKQTNTIGANFWTNALVELSIDGYFAVTCDSKASIIFIEKEESFELALSDPTQLNEGNITVELINKRIGEITRKDSSVQVAENENYKKITFSVSGKKGNSLVVSFKMEKIEIEN